MGLFSKSNAKSNSPPTSKAESSSSITASSENATSPEISWDTATVTGTTAPQSAIPSSPTATQPTAVETPAQAKTPVDNKKLSEEDDMTDDENYKPKNKDKKDKEVSLRRNILATITLFFVAIGSSV